MLMRVSFRDVATALLDLVMPRRCVVCDRRLALREKYICIGCLADFPRTFYSVMPRNLMSDRFNELIEKDLNTKNSQARPAGYSYATALFFYSAYTGYKFITRKLKYHGELGLGMYFSKLLGEEMASSEVFADVDVVVPVPLHWTRRLGRGYNQAEVIAKVISDCLGARIITNMLRRRVRTRSQARLNLESRKQNVASAFSVPAKYIRMLSSGRMNMPHHVLLVDDVFTTGATLHEAYKALRTVLPSSVRISIATLAVVGR
jgi:ComF family protein